MPRTQPRSHSTGSGGSPTTISDTAPHHQLSPVAHAHFSHFYFPFREMDITNIVDDSVSSVSLSLEGSRDCDNTEVWTGPSQSESELDYARGSFLWLEPGTGRHRHRYGAIVVL